MSRFRKSEKREVPSLSTAALPDLIFTILFFFMITGNMKDRPSKIAIDLPVASQVEEKMEDGQEMLVYIGKTSDGYVIQVDNDRVTIEDMAGFIGQAYPEKGKQDIQVVLKADKTTPMGVIGDVKKILQEKGIRKIQYVAVP